MITITLASYIILVIPWKTGIQCSLPKCKHLTVKFWILYGRLPFCLELEKNCLENCSSGGGGGGKWMQGSMHKFPILHSCKCSAIVFSILFLLLLLRFHFPIDLFIPISTKKSAIITFIIKHSCSCTGKWTGVHSCVWLSYPHHNHGYSRRTSG